MDYTLEEIYELVGKENKTAGLTFKFNSEAFKEFGGFITVEFLYKQLEREELEIKIKNKPYSNIGKVKANYLGDDLPKEKIEKLKKEGVLSSDILEIKYYNTPSNNTFNSQQIRSIKKINITMHGLQDGKDLDWMYGFYKKQVQENITLCPEEKKFYLALRYYYDSINLTEEELNDIFSDKDVLKEIEWEYLNIKFIKNDILEEEKKRLYTIMNERLRNNINILDKYLNEAGSSLKKLFKEKPNVAEGLIKKTIEFSEIRLNVTGEIPIYLDINSYFHIYMRHVEEMKINHQFDHKDNFQWNEEDVIIVIKKIIQEIDEEVQKYLKNNPGKRFSKYNDESIYFEGDYYTLHIEPNGKVSTFHKNRKNKVIQP